jgi:hypothetical protein
MLSPGPRQHRRCQAGNPVIDLSEFPEPSLLTELAAAEKVDRSFLGKLLSLTLLAPDLVQAILEGRCDAGLPSLLRPFPASWHQQASILAAGSRAASRTDGQASSDKGQSRHEAFG